MIKPSILPAILLLCFPFHLLAQPPMRGSLPAEQQEIIAAMAERHRDFKRVVELTKDGYQATTTTTDKDLAAKLKAHLKYMAARLDSKAMVRRWDPAFVELVEYYDHLDTRITEVEDGVRVVVTGKNADAVKVAQNHAQIVTGFTREGSKAVQREHKTALTEPAADHKTPDREKPATAPGSAKEPAKPAKPPGTAGR